MQTSGFGRKEVRKWRERERAKASRAYREGNGLPRCFLGRRRIEEEASVGARLKLVRAVRA